jgi:hypothetical protein
MRISELFKDARLLETATTVWSRRDDKLTKHVKRKHDVMDVKPRVRFNTEMMVPSGAD